MKKHDWNCIEAALWSMTRMSMAWFIGTLFVDLYKDGHKNSAFLLLATSFIALTAWAVSGYVEE